MEPEATAQHLPVGPRTIGRSATLDTLGSCFHVGADCGSLGACAAKWDDIRSKFLDAVGKLRVLPIGWDNRARDVGALMGGITYAAVSWDANFHTATQDQRNVVDAGGRCFIRWPSEHTEMP